MTNLDTKALEAAAQALHKDDWRPGRTYLDEARIAIEAYLSAASPRSTILEEAATAAGNYLMLKTPLDVVRIVECEEAIRSLSKETGS